MKHFLHFLQFNSISIFLFVSLSFFASEHKTGRYEDYGGKKYLIISLEMRFCFFFWLKLNEFRWVSVPPEWEDINGGFMKQENFCEGFHAILKSAAFHPPHLQSRRNSKKLIQTCRKRVIQAFYLKPELFRLNDHVDSFAEKTLLRNVSFL